MYRRALAIQEKALGPDHPDIATSLTGLAIVLESKGDYAEALQFYRRALAIAEKVSGREHPRTQKIRKSLDAVSARVGK